MRSRTATHLKIRQVYVAAAFAFLLVAGGIFVSINLTNNTESMGAVSGDYRTIASGNWTTLGIWQRYDGAAWVAATSIPTWSNNIISISAGNTVEVNSSVSVDQLEILASGTLRVSTGGTLNMRNGAGADIQVDGTLEVNATLALASNVTTTINGTERVSSTGVVSVGSNGIQTIATRGRIIREGGTFPTGTSTTLTIASGGVFEHAMDAGAIPSATWMPGSTLEITGIVANPPTNISQSFSNLIWNCTTQSGLVNLGAALTTVLQNFEIKSTGTNALMLDT